MIYFINYTYYIYDIKIQITYNNLNYKIQCIFKIQLIILNKHSPYEELKKIYINIYKILYLELVKSSNL